MDVRAAYRRKSPTSIMWKTVAGDCNLACDYCYYSTCGGKPQSEIRRIEDKLLERVIRQMMHECEGSVSFAWQGGEPLLAGLSFFQRVVQLQALYALPNTTISNAVQTNGTLIDEHWAAFFRRYSVLVGVSLDGPEEIHDKRRRTGSDRGSYRRVMAGVSALKQAEVDFNILTVIHEDNVGQAAMLMDWLEENEFRHVQFIPCMNFSAQDVDAKGQYRITPQQYGQFLCEAFDRWYNDGRPGLSVRMFDNWLQKLIGSEPELCIHQQECPSVLVLEQNGDAYPCDFFIHERYRLGNCNEDTLVQLLEEQRWSMFRSLQLRMSSPCMTCRYLHYCGGGCPRNRTDFLDVNDGGVQGRDQVDYFCESYRMLYAYGEERMRKLAYEWMFQQGIALPGRNERCICGSGRKAKKCCSTR
ncbi:anaerobic sulfatase maturase [Paenibacillus sp. ACRRX]|uniref:anaerobic sulfatase maturase n=1 Tax=Paenibacillus sp. ACRRX TaxID=2918206 RepID=UPI001EF4CC36|nr:anaerobic sulfatase maturase [Paenibacillus sp. ACRRX]MCG7409717.1 anaerobic sulfatase maturase [Paenibacillus sp. ACRRX]